MNVSRYTIQLIIIIEDSSPTITRHIHSVDSSPCEMMTYHINLMKLGDKGNSPLGI